MRESSSPLFWEIAPLQTDEQKTQFKGLGG